MIEYLFNLPAYIKVGGSLVGILLANRLGFSLGITILLFSVILSFLGLPRLPREEQLSEGSAFLLTPMFILGVFTVFIGLFPLLALPFLKDLIHQFIPGLAAADWENLMALFCWLSLATAVLGGLIVFFLALRWMLLRGREVTIFKTWDCGYQVESGRMSYTASSFAAPFMQIVAPFIPHKVQLRPPRGLFPREAGYESHHDDFVGFYLVQPLNSFIRWFMGLFTWIQSGRTQQYILYGLVFLVLLIVWIMVMP